jgi:hypothetical protein
MEMGTHARAIKTHEVTHPDWETVKSWAKATFTKERITDVVVCASSVTVLGTVLFTLYRAMETRTIVGF